MFQGDDIGKTRKKQLGQIKCFSLSVVEPTLQNRWRVLVLEAARAEGQDGIESTAADARRMRLRVGGGEEVSLA